MEENIGKDGKRPTEEEARPGKKARGPVDSGLTALALRLAKKFAAGDDRDKNITFSPLCIYTALGLVAAGARGATLEELLILLGAASRNEIAEFVRGVAELALVDQSGSAGGPLVTFACGAWHHEELVLKPAYHETAVESYKAETRAVNFKEKPEDTRVAINKWIAEATNQLITSLLPKGSLCHRTRLVLTNAIHFKAEWEAPFSKKRTEDLHFYRLDGSAVNVPFMTSSAQRFIDSHGDFKVLKLPYKAGKKNPSAPQFSMCFFLPNSRDGLGSLIDDLASSPNSLFDHLPKRKQSISKLWIPKFKLSFFSCMTEVLKSLGLHTAFDEDLADLSDMVVEMDPDGLYLADVFHKAVVEVDEVGTQAAACTVARVICRKMGSARSEEFVADHPFLFFVVEELSRAVIFVGHVLDPSSSSD